jgi:hypothetical protein
VRHALLALLMLTSPLARAADARTTMRPCSKSQEAPPVPGQVVPLFELHKDRNPANVLVVHTYADSQCRMIGSMKDKGRLVDMYWRMNAGTKDECYKPTHPMIKSETLKTLDVKSLAADKRTLKIDITQLDRVRNDLPSREAEVALAPSGSRCEAAVKLPLGPKENNAELRIQQIRAVGKYRLGIPRRAVSELELRGVDAANKPVSAVFPGK